MEDQLVSTTISTCILSKVKDYNYTVGYAISPDNHLQPGPAGGIIIPILLCCCFCYLANLRGMLCRLPTEAIHFSPVVGSPTFPPNHNHLPVLT